MFTYDLGGESTRYSAVRKNFGALNFFRKFLGGPGRYTVILEQCPVFLGSAPPPKLPGKGAHCFSPSLNALKPVYSDSTRGEINILKRLFNFGSS